MFNRKLAFLTIMLLFSNYAFAAAKVCGPSGHCCIKFIKITCTFAVKQDFTNAQTQRTKVANKSIAFTRCDDAMSSTEITDEDKAFIKTTALCQAKPLPKDTVNKLDKEPLSSSK